jgi:hypothetical protein
LDLEPWPETSSEFEKKQDAQPSSAQSELGSVEPKPLASFDWEFPLGSTPEVEATSPQRLPWLHVWSAPWAEPLASPEAAREVNLGFELSE